MKAAGHVRLWLALVFVLLILVPIAMTPDSVADRIRAEADWGQRVFGSERMGRIVERSNNAYDLTIVQTGIRSLIDASMTTDADLDQPEDRLTRKQRRVATVFNGYLHSLSLQIYGVYLRGSVMLEWLIFVGIFIVAAIVDGLTRRKIKHASGALSSPVKYTWAMHSMIAIIFSPIVYILVPATITPLFMPYWTLCMALPISITIANAVRLD